jgi:hypothetical protein
MYVPDPENAKSEANVQTLKDVISIMMRSPIGTGDPVRLDGKMSMKSLKDKSLDVQTAIAVRMANQALNGDVKSAEWLVKMGGMEPIKEQRISLDMPVFYSNPDELPDDVKQALAAETATMIESPEEDEEAVDVEYTVLPPKEDE